MTTTWAQGARFDRAEIETKVGAHALAVTRTWDDGHAETWTTEQPGPADEAHDRLAKRWREAGYDFERDKAGLSLVRRRAEPAPHTETVTHCDGGQR